MNARKMIKDIENNHADLLIDLYERWQDECKYEDINDYLIAIQKRIPGAHAITKEPFGIVVKADDSNIYVTIEPKGDKLVIYYETHDATWLENQRTKGIITDYR